MSENESANAEPARVAIWTGTFKFGPLEMECSVLDDGTRIISEDSLAAFCRWLEGVPSPGEAERFAQEYGAWARGVKP